MTPSARLATWARMVYLDTRRRDPAALEAAGLRATVREMQRERDHYRALSANLRARLTEAEAERDALRAVLRESAERLARSWRAA